MRVLASGYMFSKAADHKVNVAENEEGIWRENAVTYCPVKEDDGKYRCMVVIPPENT